LSAQRIGTDRSTVDLHALGCILLQGWQAQRLAATGCRATDRSSLQQRVDTQRVTRRRVTQKFLSDRSVFDFGFCPYIKHGKGAESGVARIDTGHPCVAMAPRFLHTCDRFLPI